MTSEPSELAAARGLAASLGDVLARAPAFHSLPSATQAALLQDVATIRSSLGGNDPYALALDSPPGFRRPTFAPPAAPAPPAAGSGNGAAAQPRPPATETLASRAGALIDEVGFPEFVAGLVHSTFDAVVDASIRQMEAFAELVSAVAKDVDEFTRDNVTLNQARDHLAQQHPRELRVDVPPDGGEPQLRVLANEDDEPPEWLADYGLAGEPLTDELVERQLVPAARRSVGESRLKTLATLVLLGMNRINVRDGKISARVRFRAAANDTLGVQYASVQDPQTWGARGAGPAAHSTMVSTVGVNAQADTDLRAELFGQVEINFVSETLPLDRFADSARISLLQRNARVNAPPVPAGQPVPPAATPASAPAPTSPELTP